MRAAVPTWGELERRAAADGLRFKYHYGAPRRGIPHPDAAGHSPRLPRSLATHLVVKVEVWSTAVFELPMISVSIFEIEDDEDRTLRSTLAGALQALLDLHEG